jgi:LAO/AO transport system kinase
MRLDGSDPDVFVRSMAARGRLGGLAPRAFEAVTVMRAAADVVLVETVGVGQSEVEVADLVEVTAVVIQPGSGDALQFLKAGLMEVFDRLVVNKSDLGALASNAARELRAALRLQGRREVPVHLVSAEDGAGIDVLADALVGGTPDPGRRGDALRRLMVDRFRAWHGERIVVALGGHAALVEALAGAPDRDTMTPGAAWEALESRLRG